MRLQPDTARGFILANTARHHPPHVPEIALRLADEAYGLWRRTEEELAIALHEGKAEAGFGLGALAGLYGLGFVALGEERFDLAVWRRAWFDPPMQKLMRFLASPACAARADELGGYDLSGLGRVHHNGASG